MIALLVLAAALTQSPQYPPPAVSESRQPNRYDDLERTFREIEWRLAEVTRLVEEMQRAKKLPKLLRPSEIMPLDQP